MQRNFRIGLTTKKSKMKTAKETLEIRMPRLQRESTVFRFAQRFKNIPFIGVTFEYELPKDRLSCGRLFVIFELEKWTNKIVNNPITGLRSIEYTRHTNNNTIKVAMLYN